MVYSFKTVSVLVVDDMTPMLSLVTSMLKIFGIKTIYQATDPDEAFRIFCDKQPDLVITDWLMQPYDGTEFVKKIRNDPRSPNRFVPVIMMTGYSHRIRVEEARDNGITEFLVKPFRAEDLTRRIEQLIEKPRQFVEAQSFFGPDRRRRKGEDYSGPLRRSRDASGKDGSTEGAQTAALLRELKEKAREAGRDKK